MSILLEPSPFPRGGDPGDGDSIGALGREPKTDRQFLDRLLYLRALGLAVRIDHHGETSGRLD